MFLLGMVVAFISGARVNDARVESRLQRGLLIIHGWLGGRPWQLSAAGRGPRQRGCVCTPDCHGGDSDRRLRQELEARVVGRARRGGADAPVCPGGARILPRTSPIGLGGPRRDSASCVRRMGRPPWQPLRPAPKGPAPSSARRPKAPADGTASQAARHKPRPQEKGIARRHRRPPCMDFAPGAQSSAESNLLPRHGNAQHGAELALLPRSLAPAATATRTLSRPCACPPN